jgi:hypothetical protein
VPRSRSTAIQSERTRRRSPRALTCTSGLEDGCGRAGYLIE